MQKQRHKIIPTAHLVLMKNNKILMIRRYNTGYEDGNYSLPAGHLDGGETFKQAMIREAKEEANIILNPENLRVIHAMHRYAKPNPLNLRERIDIFIMADRWGNEPKNMEPHKCDHLDWFLTDNIPENTIPYIKQALMHIKQNIFYSEFGF